MASSKYKVGDKVVCKAPLEGCLSGDGDWYSYSVVRGVHQDAYDLDHFDVQGICRDSCIFCLAFDDGNIIPFSPDSTSSPLSIMSVVQQVRTIFLSKEERLYREHGLKDSCGNWTDEARQVFIEQLMNDQHTDVLLPIAKKLDAEKRD